MNNSYNVNMAKINEARNSLIVTWCAERYTTNEVIEKLKAAGYAAISRSRIWSIYKNSPAYKARKARIMFCTFCLENKAARDMFQGKRPGEYRVEFRMCNECKEHLTPIQPIENKH